jgi:hypothetical protein
MADVYTSLADLVKINDMNLADLEISDLLQDAPLLAALAADVASNGTDHKYLKETGAPVVGFRAANDGRENKASADTLVTINLKILDASFLCDKALADAYRKGSAAYLAREGKRHMKAAFYHAEKQLIMGTGTGGDSGGFTGLVNAATIDAVADAMVVNAGGDSANACTTVFAIRTNDAGTDCTVITGNDGQIDMGDTVVQRVAGATTGHYPAYFTPISSWLGLQIGSAYSVGRIVNLDFDHMLDDDMISDLLSKFPAGREPNLLVMNRTSRKQLQQSRTATNQTGAPAPFPTEAFGVPIVVTEGITNTIAVVA